MCWGLYRAKLASSFRMMSAGPPFSVVARRLEEPSSLFPKHRRYSRDTVSSTWFPGNGPRDFNGHGHLHSQLLPCTPTGTPSRRTCSRRFNGDVHSHLCLHDFGHAAISSSQPSKRSEDKLTTSWIPDELFRRGQLA